VRGRVVDFCRAPLQVRWQKPPKTSMRTGLTITDIFTRRWERARCQYAAATARRPIASIHCDHLLVLDMPRRRPRPRRPGLSRYLDIRQQPAWRASICGRVDITAARRLRRNPRARTLCVDRRLSQRPAMQAVEWVRPTISHSRHHSDVRCAILPGTDPARFALPLSYSTTTICASRAAPPRSERALCGMRRVAMGAIDPGGAHAPAAAHQGLFGLGGFTVTEP